MRSVTSNTRADAREFLAFAGRHHIDVTSPEYPLARADEALTDLSAGRISGAAVLLVVDLQRREGGTQTALEVTAAEPVDGTVAVGEQ